MITGRMGLQKTGKRLKLACATTENKAFSRAPTASKNCSHRKRWAEDSVPEKKSSRVPKSRSLQWAAPLKERSYRRPRSVRIWPPTKELQLTSFLAKII